MKHPSPLPKEYVPQQKREIMNIPACTSEQDLSSRRKVLMKYVLQDQRDFSADELGFLLGGGGSI